MTAPHPTGDVPDREDLDLASFAPEAVRKQYRTAPWIAVPVRGLMRLFGRRIETGTENFPHEGPAIVVPYHASYLDPFLVGLSVWQGGRLPHFLAKAPLFTGVAGTALRAIGQIPVLRGSQKAVDSLYYAKAALEAGEVVVIYPQGTLTKDPDLWPENSKTGAARLALHTGAPIIPVSHWGLQRSMPVGAKLPKPTPGNTPTVHYGDPIEYADLLGDEHAIRRLTERITAHIALGVAQLSGRELPQRFRSVLDKEQA